MRRPACFLLLTLFSLTTHSPARCQGADFVSILSGDKYPLTLKLKDLDSTWRTTLIDKVASHAYR